MNLKATLEHNKFDTEMLKRIASELNGWDSSFEELNPQEFDDEFFNTYFEGNPLEAARATYFGTIENWNDGYIRFNGYGNLESLGDYQLDKELVESADELIEAAIEQADNIDIDYITEEVEKIEEEA